MRRRDFLRGLLGAGAVAAVGEPVVQALLGDLAAGGRSLADVATTAVDWAGEPLTLDALDRAIAAVRDAPPPEPPVIFMSRRGYENLQAVFRAQERWTDEQLDAWLDEDDPALDGIAVARC